MYEMMDSIHLLRLFIENLLIKYHSIIFFFNKNDFLNKLNGWFNTNTIGIMKWIASFFRGWIQW